VLACVFGVVPDAIVFTPQKVNVPFVALLLPFHSKEDHMISPLSLETCVVPC